MERVKGTEEIGKGPEFRAEGKRYMDAMKVKTCGSHVDDKIVIM